MLAFPVAIFSAAFLVFQIQPIVAKLLLPDFGGSPSVWTTCMLFFQLALLLGYAYAHFLISFLKTRTQVALHCLLLVLSLIFLPVFPEFEATADGLLTLEILFGLLASVGFPFVLIASSAPLMQAWFSSCESGSSPFRLYALSNLGSLLALISYPFLVEPILNTTDQVWVWSVIYGLFVLLSVLCAIRVLKPAQQAHISLTLRAVGQAEVSRNRKLIWVFFSSCGSVLLLSVTNKLSQDVAVIPFLWVLPLSLYLLSFIICFEHDRWYKRFFWYPLLLVTLSILVYLLSLDFSSTEWPLVHQLVVYCVALFVACMVCHGELARSKPEAGCLTSFYLYLAFGGALGGVFVGLLAPVLFNGFWELHLGLFALSVAVCLIVFVKCMNFRKIFGFGSGIVSLASLTVLSWFLIENVQDYKKNVIAQERGFFGVISVRERAKDKFEHIRTLYSGRINHGSQWLRPGREMKAATYYAKNTGIALAFRNHPRRLSGSLSLKSGVIGLGTGTIATFGRPGDQMIFYEIDPNIDYIAREYFSYLDKTEAQIKVLLGDGRRSLQRDLLTKGSEQFDLLVIDAFSGDSIPVHLLTEQAAQLYWKHLKPDGLLVIHITNFHLDLSGVVRQMALNTEKSIVYIPEKGDDYYSLKSDWVIMTSNSSFLNHPEVLKRQAPWRDPDRPLVNWTDGFSNLISVLRWE